MASPSELSLECKPSSYSMLLKSIRDQSDQTQKLEDFLGRLEEERLKIDAFKRELPLCMQLLNNAMEASRIQLEQFQLTQGTKPVFEEFIPLKHPNVSDEATTNMQSDKANWMTSAQLWSQANHAGTKHQADNTSLKDLEPSLGISPKLAIENKHRNGGAFLPFTKAERSSSTSPGLPELALAPTDKDQMEEKKCMDADKGINACQRREINSSKLGNGAPGAIVEQGKLGAAMSAETQGITPTSTTQTHRKARRCWSPDLHKRFVNALQMLGGSQVATPKQIRELMKVDGLTNDEVKSHLQKYRLHTRRPSPVPQAPTAQARPHVVVLGGIWVQPEYATAAVAHGAPPALYGAHPASHTAGHYCPPPVAQEFYPPAGAHATLHHPNMHQLITSHQQHTYKASPHAHSSPESEGIRGGGGRSESIEEDGKSDCSSWKGDSGDNGEGGDAKGLLSLREEGEESNGSEITLKF